MKILKGGAEELSKICMPVENFDEELQKQISEMAKLMVIASGIGLAANQVGILNRVFIMDTGKELKAFVNPEMLEATGKTKTVEGCLSFPSIQKRIKRKSFVKLKYFTTQGEERIETFNGVRAVCIQHEIDHLNGITILDHWGN